MCIGLFIYVNLYACETLCMCASMRVCYHASEEDVFFLSWILQLTASGAVILDWELLWMWSHRSLLIHFDQQG